MQLLGETPSLAGAAAAHSPHPHRDTGQGTCPGFPLPSCVLHAPVGRKLATSWFRFSFSQWTRKSLSIKSQDPDLKEESPRLLLRVPVAPVLPRCFFVITLT